ncbi:MAG TPA: pyridoxamine 5'-phosphate oxidase family protein [Mycobacteriales bacterium]|nr:pyridoxamine 5'-phosphate oxidase family protein [Mycobacteriales bacterium]
MEGATAARLEELFADGSAVMVVTRDDDHNPHVTRGWGGVVDAENGRLDLCLTTSDDLMVVPDLEANGAIAVTVAHTATYRAMQVTGTVEWIGEITEDDRARIARHVEQFTAQVVRAGLPPTIARIAGERFVAVRIAVQQCFEQTPGPKAGSAL